MNYVVDALDRHGVPYAITGSHASNVFGETRFTYDIDVVIDLRSLQLLEELLTEFRGPNAVLRELIHYAAGGVRCRLTRVSRSSNPKDALGMRSWIFSSRAR